MILWIDLTWNLLCTDTLHHGLSIFHRNPISLASFLMKAIELYNEDSWD